MTARKACAPRKPILSTDREPVRYADRKTPISLRRRHFLLGAGGAMLAVPFLPSLSGTPEAFASSPDRKRFISYRITNGFFGHHWYPTNAATTGLRVVEPNVREMMLADIAGPISPLLDARFDVFREKMILMRHIDRLDWSDHNSGNGLLGWSSADASETDLSGLPPSIDRIMTDNLFGGTTSPLNLCIRWSSEGVSCSYTRGPTGTLEMDPGLFPHQAYTRLFSDFELDVSVATRRRGYERTIVDRVLPHYRSVRDNPRLSTGDRATLDQHMEHMNRLSAQLARGVAECAPPPAITRFDRTPEEVDGAAQACIDIAVAALRCGLVNVVNFYLDPDTIFSDELHGVAGGHHGASHNGDAASVQSIENAHLWHMRYLVDLLTKLDETVDPVTGSTLLDDSLVFVNNEIGNQNGRSGIEPGDLDLNHIGVDVQCMIIGSCCGALRTGTFLDYRTDFERSRWTRYIGTAYNRLLVSCMLAMGLTPAHWEEGGSPGYGDMRGAQYDQTPLDQVVLGDMRAMLPRLGAT